MIAVRSAWFFVNIAKISGEKSGRRKRNGKKRNEGVGRDGRRRWSVGEEIDESGEMEHEIVKPLRENVAENGLFRLRWGWKGVWLAG